MSHAFISMTAKSPQVRLAFRLNWPFPVPVLVDKIMLHQVANQLIAAID